MKRIKINIELRRKEFKLKCDLDIPGKGVIAILGPSGSGKTTLLRSVAGLEKPDQGAIKVNGNTWLDTSRKKYLSPQKRKVGMVFQDYALFEHLTVAQNIGYGVSRTERKHSIQKWLKILHLESLEARFPHDLSGGQRQRVALARALATEPDILLLDEPFSAVDVALRESLRVQLQEIVASLEQPVLMVTHDLDEARYLADYIAVMVDGEVKRFDLASRVFDEPGNYEVAKILGWRNFLPVKSITSGSVSGEWGTLVLDREISPDTDWLSIRPYHIRIAHDMHQALRAKVRRVTELGALREMQCQLSDGSIMVMQSTWHDPLLAPGSEIGLQLPMQHVRTLCEGTPVKNLQQDRAIAIPIKEVEPSGEFSGAALTIKTQL